MSSALSSNCWGWVTLALLTRGGPLPSLGAAPDLRALQEHGMGGDMLPALLSPGVGWGHLGVVRIPQHTLGTFWGNTHVPAQDGDTLGLQTSVLQPPHLPSHGHPSHVPLPSQLSPCRQLISILPSSSCNSSTSCSLRGRKETQSSIALVAPS